MSATIQCLPDIFAFPSQESSLSEGEYRDSRKSDKHRHKRSRSPSLSDSDSGHESKRRRHKKEKVSVLEEVAVAFMSEQGALLVVFKFQHS